MLFSLLADATVILHLGFVVFVVLGGLAVLRRPQLAWAHLPAVVWGAWVEFFDWMCPLTPLENWFRQKAGAGTYATGFVEHYVVPILYPGSLSRRDQWLLGGVVLLVNLVVYGALLRRHRPRRP